MTNGANSWATIASGQVALPAALRLELTNTAGGGRYDNLWLALNAEHDPANFSIFRRGRRRQGLFGEQRQLFGWFGGCDCQHVGNATSWRTQRTRGGRFAMMGRLEYAFSPGVSVRRNFRWMVRRLAGNGPWVLNRTSAQLSMLGVVPLPPQSWDATPNAAITLLLRRDVSRPERAA